MKSTLLRIATAALIALPAAGAAADWPTKPLRVVIPFPAGGPTDGVTRTVMSHVSKTLGQPVVVENKPGAEGAIAAQTVATAPADGYTFLVATSSVMALPVLAVPAPFQPSDLAPVASFGSFAFGLFVHPGVPAGTVKELVAHLKANPGKLNFASANFAEHLAAAQFLKATGTDMVRVPYKGAAQAIPDLLAGRVQAYFTPLVAGLQQAKEGRLRLLAVMLPARSALAPDVPTLAEAGVEGVGVQSMQVMAAPARTSREVVDRASRAIAAALADPEVRSQLQARALFVEAFAPQELAARLARGNQEWAEFARANPVDR